MSEYYDIETIVTQKVTYLNRSKNLSKSNFPGGILEFKKRIEEDAIKRCKRAGGEHFDVNVQVFLHEAMPPAPQAEPLPCPFCGSKTKVDNRKSLGGKLWYRVVHVEPDVDKSCPLAFASKPIHMDHETPEEAVENWNRWCEHVKA